MRIARSAFWVTFGTVVSRAFTFVGSVTVARTLGREGFGELGIIQSTISTFQLFAAFGLGLTSTKFVAELRTADPARAGRIIGLSHVVALITGSAAALGLAFSAPPLARSMLAAPQLSRALVLASVTVALSAYNGSQMGALAGFEAFRKIARINIITALVSAPLLIGGVLIAGVEGAVCSLSITSLITCFLSHRELGQQARSHEVQISHRCSLVELPVLWSFTVPAVLAGLFVQPVNWVCNAMLVHQPNGYWHMGVFSAASQWRTLMSMVPTMLMQGVLPVLAASHSRGATTPDFQRSLKLTQSTMVMFSFPLAAILMFGSEALLRIYGREFPGSGAVVIGMVATALVQSIGAATGPAIEARGRMWFALAINVSWGCVYMGFTALSVGRLGANALAYGQATAYAFITVWGFRAMRRDLPPGMFGRVMASLCVACALTFAAAITPTTLRALALLPATVLTTAIAVRALADREIVVALTRRLAHLLRSRAP